MQLLVALALLANILLAALTGAVGQAPPNYGYGYVWSNRGTGTSYCDVTVKADDGRNIRYIGFTKEQCRRSLTAAGTRVAFVVIPRTRIATLLIEAWSIGEGK